MKHWLAELLKNLDLSTDEKTKQSILEKCGAKCPFSHMPDARLAELSAESQNEKEFLGKLCKTWRLALIRDRYFVIFDKCYCPLVNENMKIFSQTMCYCTLGSLKHKFSMSLGRKIEVKMLKTVLAGDDECRFEIEI